MIGLDTSHAVAFTKLLNNPHESYHVPGGEVVVAFAGGSPNFELSMSRVKGFTEQLCTRFHVKIVDSIEQVAAESDAILLESVDGAVHHEQLRAIVAYQKPIFIDKPFSLSSQVASDMIRLAEDYQTPLMSTSALRYAEGLTGILQQVDKGKIIGADCFGPMEMQATQPGFFWYGIHTVEMLFAILGRGAQSVMTLSSEGHDAITASWTDGRIGTIRGNRHGNSQFGAIIHFEHGSEFVAIHAQQKPYYASLLEQIIAFFQDGVSRVPLQETHEIIRLIEAANESLRTGRIVQL
ncbi:Gfo/Idh/MocA family protein [Sporosarcina sp. YIM B06819]|uniref:Gfo/Idh/MocA family protein n=1 Tax=Sporosarcina sp. YIM B06819 TaxID=3081769 RepID=UPI00298D3322|nr:Gfo/Idh/MocA family oxidoreductase [Sporosarcina sp. YIM B06819]